MKRVKYAIVLLLAIFTIRTYGDIIIVEYSPTKICVRITNLSDYPDIAIIGFSDCFATLPKVNIVDSISCLEVRKACPLTFYAVKKDYLIEKGIKNINWKKDKNVMKSNMTFTGKETTWYQNVGTMELNLYIAGFKENSMVMYQKSSTLKFKNDKPDILDESNIHPGIWYSLDSLQVLYNLRKTF